MQEHIFEYEKFQLNVFCKTAEVKNTEILLFMLKFKNAFNDTNKNSLQIDVMLHNEMSKNLIHTSLLESFTSSVSACLEPMIKNKTKQNSF